MYRLEIKVKQTIIQNIPQIEIIRSNDDHKREVHDLKVGAIKCQNSDHCTFSQSLSFGRNDRMLSI